MSRRQMVALLGAVAAVAFVFGWAGSRAGPIGFGVVGPTPTPTRDALQSLLEREIDAYVPLYEKYRPRPAEMFTPSKWRTLEAVLEGWLPQHPEFAAYYRWVQEQYPPSRANAAATRSPNLLRSRLPDYLTERYGRK